MDRGFRGALTGNPAIAGVRDCEGTESKAQGSNAPRENDRRQTPCGMQSEGLGLVKQPDPV